MANPSLHKNIARLMVRRHLRSWLGSDILSEDLLIAFVVRTAREYPDESMQAVAVRVDQELRELVGIVLGREIEVVEQELRDLGIDP